MCGYFCIGFIDFMVAGQTLTDFTNLFSPNNFKKSGATFCDKCLKMTDFHETINMYPNLNFPRNDQHCRQNEINGIGNYFVAKIKGTELMRKKLSKYIASFDYFDKPLHALSVTLGSISVALLATVTGAPVGITSLSF